LGQVYLTVVFTQVVEVEAVHLHQLLVVQEEQVVVEMLDQDVIQVVQELQIQVVAVVELVFPVMFKQVVQEALV
jgi:hypothetical protein